MNREIREIIKALNLTVSILVTGLLMRLVFWGIGWWRVLIIAVITVICLFKALEEAERYYMRKGAEKRNEAENGRFKGKSGQNVIRGIPWHEMRYSEIVKGDGDC